MTDRTVLLTLPGTDPAEALEVAVAFRRDYPDRAGYRHGSVYTHKRRYFYAWRTPSGAVHVREEPPSFGRGLTADGW